MVGLIDRYIADCRKQTLRSEPPHQEQTPAEIYQPANDQVCDALCNPEARRLILAYYNIEDEAVRDKVLHLARLLCGKTKAPQHQLQIIHGVSE